MSRPTSEYHGLRQAGRGQKRSVRLLSQGAGPCAALTSPCPVDISTDLLLNLVKPWQNSRVKSDYLSSSLGITIALSDGPHARPRLSLLSSSSSECQYPLLRLCAAPERSPACDRRELTFTFFQKRTDSSSLALQRPSRNQRSERRLCPLVTVTVATIAAWSTIQ